MKVLEPHEPTISNSCIICETGLNRATQHIVVDTGYDFDQPGHPLDGRKTICQGCVYDLARAAGLMTATQLAETQDYLRQYRIEAEAVVRRVQISAEQTLAALESLPNAPNLDHFFIPSHVLDGARKVDEEERASRDFVVVEEGASF